MFSAESRSGVIALSREGAANPGGGSGPGAEARPGLAARPGKARRILYGVQGEGRGHATRSLQVMEQLRKAGHEVTVLSGGDALALLLQAGFPVVQIPQLRYRYDKTGRLDPWATVAHNFPLAFGLLLRRGAKYREVKAMALEHRPDLVISDFEPYLSRVCRVLHIPLVALDHQHFLTESIIPPLKNPLKSLMLFLYQVGTNLFTGRPDRIITSSFYHFPKKKASRAVFVGPFIHESLKGLKPSDGGYYTVYLKQPCYLAKMLPVLSREPGRRFEIFSDFSKAPAPAGLPDNVRLHPLDRKAFLASLAGAGALLTTAGNQVLGEAIYLGKPILAFPEPEVLEQELNALALRRSGFGETFDLQDFEGAVLDRFEERTPLYRKRIARHFRRRGELDGKRLALLVLEEVIESFLGEPETSAAAGSPVRSGLGAAPALAAS